MRVKELEGCGAGQRGARIGLVEFGTEGNPLSEIRCIEVYVSSENSLKRK